MADKGSMGEQRYIAVDINHFRGADREISFDLYLMVSVGNYVHVFSRSSGLDYQRLAQYVGRGVKELYLREEERGEFEKFVAFRPERVLNDETATNEKKIATLLNLTEQNMAEIFNQLNVPEETARHTESLVRGYVTLMGQSPESLALLIKLASMGDHLYSHSVAVAVFSILLARSTGQFDRATIEKVGMGGFLHDIGCARLATPETAFVEDSAQMREHPSLGLEMVEGNPRIPEEVRFIIYQHHERVDGKGFPNGLKGPAIFYPAQVVGIADEFSTMMKGKRSEHVVEAVKRLRSARGSFDARLVEVFADMILPSTRKSDRAA